MSLRKLLNKGLNKIGYKLVRYSQFDDILEREYQRDPDFVFVQLGANDGVTFDELHDFVMSHECRGLVVEPIRDYFEQLAANYQDYPDIIPVNKAIHKDKKTATMYRVPNSHAPKRRDRLRLCASLVPDHHTTKRVNVPEELIVPEEVPCISLMGLLKEHGLDKLNLLQIDVEGYDLEVIQMIDFKVIKPRIIKYEWVHLSKEAQREARSILVQAGYRVFKERIDCIALLQD